VLAETGVDLLVATTFPAASEALGVVRAMAGTGLPHAVSFVMKGSGSLLGGTSLVEVICVHPSVLQKALRSSDERLRRLAGGRLLDGHGSGQRGWRSHARKPSQLDCMLTAMASGTWRIALTVPSSYCSIHDSGRRLGTSPIRDGIGNSDPGGADLQVLATVHCLRTVTEVGR
jgi:hypothetical protein